MIVALNGSHKESAMQCRAMTLSSLLILCLMWTNSAFGQTMAEEIAAMKTEITDMKGLMERILAGRRATDRLLADAIVLTDQDCAVLGPDWKRFEAIGGRFPLAAGKARDAREEERTFAISQNGGAYLHLLTVAEMPRHNHQNPIRGSTSRRDRMAVEPASVAGQFGGRHARDTNFAGGNKPHNNMPPYLVMNFCHKAGNGD